MPTESETPVAVTAAACRSDLARMADAPAQTGAEPARDAPPTTDGEGVFYTSHGRVALLCDDPGMAARALEHFSGGTVLLLVIPGVAPADKLGVKIETGPARRVEGWLGAFQLTLEDGGGAETIQDADVILDLCARKASGAAVPPIGYLAAAPDVGDSTLKDLCQQASELKGVFRKPKYFTYTADICAHDVRGQTGCTRCLDVCDADAIRSAGGQIVVEPHLCQGCSSCTLACPTGALSPARPPRQTSMSALHHVLAREAPGTAAVVAHTPAQAEIVAQAAPKAIPVQTATMALFGEEMWFAALAEGAAKVVVMADPEAPEHAGALLAERLDTASAIAEAMGYGSDAIAPATPQTLAEAARVSAEPGRTRASVPPDNPERKRDLLNAALERLEPADGFAPVPLPAGAPLGAIEVDTAACVMCGFCARSCPTAAIRYEESDPVALQFAEKNCIQCGLCTRICPESAITLKPRIAPSAQRNGWRTLNTSDQAACPECGKRFVAASMLAAIMRQFEERGVNSEAMREHMRKCPECRQRAAYIM